MAESTKQSCIYIVKELGFRINEELGGNFYKDYGGFDCLLYTTEDWIRLSVYGKQEAISDHAYMGPPLPAEKVLRAFIKYNAG